MASCPSCPVCGAAAAATDRFAPARLCRCEACTLVFREMVDETQIRSLYDDGTYGVDRLAAHTRRRRHDADLRARWTRAHAPPGDLLDVGAGTGFFVAAAAGCGYAASGVEPTDLHASHAREHLGVDVRTGYLEELTGAEPAYDVITMWHVLEHVPDPVALLSAVATRLRPGGRVVLEVPNIESVGAELMRGRWAHLDPVAHVSHFSPRALGAALERAGLRAERTQTLLEVFYDPWPVRLRPRRLAGRIVRAARLRTLRLEHPARGELLRAVARPTSG